MSFVLGGGSGNAPVDSNRYARGAQAVVLPAAGVTPPTGKVFLYWSAAGDSTRCYPGGKLTVTGDMTLTAVYGQKTENVKVTYHSNFAQDMTYTTADMPNNSMITLPGYTGLGLPENPGYTFAGWNTQADGLGTTYMPGDKVLVDTMDPGNHLYAIWAKGSYPLTIHYVYASGGAAKPDHTEVLDFGAPYSVTSPSIPGYTADKPVVTGTMPAAPVTVTVTYTASTGTPDTVVFDPNNINGKTLAAKSLTVYSGSAPWETFEVVVKEPAGTQRSSGTVRLSGGSQSASFTGFDPITFPAAGTYTFTVGEVDRNTRYMSYDRNLYTLTVKVEEKGGMLVISDVYYTNAAGRSYWEFPIVFSNTYGSYTPHVPVIPPKTPDKLNADDHFAYVIGYPDGGVHPHATITRAEAMALINRVLNRNPESKDELLRSMNIFNDNLDTAKWYYLDVQEAANSHDYIRKANGYEMWKKLRADPDWKALER